MCALEEKFFDEVHRMSEFGKAPWKKRSANLSQNLPRTQSKKFNEHVCQESIVAFLPTDLKGFWSGARAIARPQKHFVKWFAIYLVRSFWTKYSHVTAKSEGIREIFLTPSHLALRSKSECQFYQRKEFYFCTYVHNAIFSHYVQK